MLKHLADAGSAVAALTAAGLWWWASCVPIPPFPDVGFDTYSSVFDPVWNALSTGSRRNAWAARTAGLAAALQALSSLLG